MDRSINCHNRDFWIPAFAGMTTIEMAVPSTASPYRKKIQLITAKIGIRIRQDQII